MAAADHDRITAAIAKVKVLDGEIAELELLVAEADGPRGKWFLCLDGSECKPVRVDKEDAKKLVEAVLSTKQAECKALDDALIEATKALP